VDELRRTVEGKTLRLALDPDAGAQATKRFGQALEILGCSLGHDIDVDGHADVAVEDRSSRRPRQSVRRDRSRELAHRTRSARPGVGRETLESRES
jgi:hypothetical protein